MYSQIPFNYFLTYRFSLEEDAYVSIKLYNALGKSVLSITNNTYYEKGLHKITWNSQDNNNAIPAGFYILTLEVDRKIVKKEKIIKNFSSY